MPPNRVANIRRAIRFADAALRRSSASLANVWITILPQHPDVAGELFAMIVLLDVVRILLLRLYLRHWGGTTRSLHDPADLCIILENAQKISDPSGRAP